MNTQPPAGRAAGGGPGDGGGRRSWGGRSRRAKNRRYRQNRKTRSRLQIISWNAEGLRPKQDELLRWLCDTKADVVAIQEAQLAANKTPSLQGYQTAVVSRRARGRRTTGPVKGGDVLILVRDGLPFSVIEDSPLPPQDDTTEWCAVKVHLVSSSSQNTSSQNASSQNTSSSSSKTNSLTIYNIYRPPIRTSEADERTDHFELSGFPTSPEVIITGDVNGHHPAWDQNCLEPDRVGNLVHDWTTNHNWEILNTGEPTRDGYGNGPPSAPDVSLAHRDLAGRCTWKIGMDLGSDHLPQVITASIGGSRPRRIRKAKWAFHKARWTDFTRRCEEALSDPPSPELSLDAETARVTDAIMSASKLSIPRGARSDPIPWAADPDLEQAVSERRAARAALRFDPSAEAKTRWKTAKTNAAAVEEAARTKCFRQFATEELNKPSNLGRVTKILRRMEGATQPAAPGRAIHGDHGREAVLDKKKASEFVKTYAAVSKHVRHKKWDHRTKTAIRDHLQEPCKCGSARSEACQPFSLHELDAQLRKLKPKKAPGPDGVCAEHLRNLGPLAKAAVLHLINRSWLSSQTPKAWREATIIPIPKSGKNPQQVSSYRPIALTSNMAKLAERLIGARLSHIIERDALVPPEQVGFRRGRAAEENLGRLIQTVQDGWNKPKARGRPQDGATADKFVLVAYDFARAYDTIDHHMLYLKLLRQIPHCMAKWIFHFLRDRSARVEVNGTLSPARPFRAGLPQGSVLAPTLYTLWSADLIEELRAAPGTHVFMYADDTATLSSGCDIELARSRAQKAADIMARWAERWKMRIAGAKTQVLALSQWSKDAAGLSIKVAGTPVPGTDQLKLLGVTFDRLLHFGAHCRSLRRKVTPRIAQLRKLTGRSWGLREPQLRTVANGYVRGALEYAAAAWLPAASSSHAELVDRELRAAARVVTGCPLSTPSHAVLAEAGIPPVAVRRPVLAARLVALADSLPEQDPLRLAAAPGPRRRLRGTDGWREVGREALNSAGAADLPIEQRLRVTLPPWTATDGITFCLSVGPSGARTASAQLRREAAEAHLQTLPSPAIWVWTDGSADDGVTNGGGGAIIFPPSGDPVEVRAPAGSLCSSTRAELIAIREATTHVTSLDTVDTTLPINICLDSKAALATLEPGPAAQTTELGADVWRQLLLLQQRGHHVHLQWVPAHCGVAGNERADVLAKDAGRLPQTDVPIDVRTATCAVKRAAGRVWRSNWPPGWFTSIWAGTAPPPLRTANREDAVETHQLRAGHWSGSAQYLHRIGRNPSPTCTGCADKSCPAALCPICREEADTPDHVLTRCPALAGTRLRCLGNIHTQPTELRRGDVVAALAAANRFLRSHTTTPRP